MNVTKDLSNKVFDSTYIWGETLLYSMGKNHYHYTFKSFPDQSIYGRYMIFSLYSVVNWQVLAAAKQRQVEIGNVRKKSRRVTHDYEIGDQV